MAAWCKKNRIRTKGHPLCWHEVCPRWLRAKTPDQVETLQWNRITREVTAFRGLIDTWDVVNEAVVMPNHEGGRNPIAALCRKHTQVGLIQKTFARARAANPKATLLLNDFVVDARYEKLLRECLDKGVSIDVIGIQSHMHRRYWGARRAWQVCRRFAKFDKPLHFTELTILSGALKQDNDWQRHRPGWATTTEGEKRQARQVAELYTTLFSHPAVEAITWWDFTDQGSWQHAPAGWLDDEMNPKPVFETMKRLIRRTWWTRLEEQTDTQGVVRFRGFHGDYVITVHTPDGRTATETFELGATGLAEVRVK